MTRPLCKRTRQLKEAPDRYLAKVEEPRLICTRCGRLANRKKYLCQPEKPGKLRS